MRKLSHIFKGISMSIYFKYTTDEYGCLSNFSPHPITIDGVVWKSTEAYYQAQKFLSEAIREEIRAKPTPKAAKVWAYTYKDCVRKDWQDMSLATMEKALRAKLEQNSDVKQKLLDSGTQSLYEQSSSDWFWGTGADGTGRNELGKLWMKLRSELQIAKTIDPKAILEIKFRDAGNKVIDEHWRQSNGYAGRDEQGGSDF